MDIEQTSDELIMAALTVTEILYRDSAVVLRDPIIRSTLLPKLLNIIRAIGLPETEKEQLLLNNVARLAWRMRQMNRQV